MLSNLSHLSTLYNVFFNAMEILGVGLGSSQNPVGCSLRVLSPKLSYNSKNKQKTNNMTKS